MSKPVKIQMLQQDIDSAKNGGEAVVNAYQRHMSDNVVGSRGPGPRVTKTRHGYSLLGVGNDEAGRFELPLPQNVVKFIDSFNSDAAPIAFELLSADVRWAGRPALREGDLIIIVDKDPSRRTVTIGLPDRDSRLLKPPAAFWEELIEVARVRGEEGQTIIGRILILEADDEAAKNAMILLRKHGVDV